MGNKNSHNTILALARPRVPLLVIDLLLLFTGLVLILSPFKAIASEAIGFESSAYGCKIRCGSQSLAVTNRASLDLNTVVAACPAGIRFELERDTEGADVTSVRVYGSAENLLFSDSVPTGHHKDISFATPGLSVDCGAQPRQQSQPDELYTCQLGCRGAGRTEVVMNALNPAIAASEHPFSCSDKTFAVSANADAGDDDSFRIAVSELGQNAKTILLIERITNGAAAEDLYLAHGELTVECRNQKAGSENWAFNRDGRLPTIPAASILGHDSKIHHPSASITGRTGAEAPVSDLLQAMRTR